MGGNSRFVIGSNTTILGEIGLSNKTITFKKSDFKKELAPSNARIEEYEVNGESFIKMHFEYKTSP